MAEKRDENLRRQAPATIVVPLGQVRVLESHHAADFAMEPGAWGFHKICWVAVGNGSIDYSGDVVPIQRDDFLIVPAGVTHRFIDDPGAPLTLVILCISEDYFSAVNDPEMNQLWSVLAQDELLGLPYCAKTAFYYSRLVEVFRYAMNEQDQRRIGWETALKSAANDLLIYLVRSFCEPRFRHIGSSLKDVEGAIEYINNHLREALLIEDVASRCSLSPRRFTDLFKQLTGETFNQYLNHKRIDYACQRLEETHHILYACHESGFNELGYFYRVFKKIRGITPGHYLRNIKAK